MKPSLRALFVLPIVALTALPLSAQDAGDILRKAVTEYESRMSGVENYTIVQEVMGMQHSTRFERQESDGVLTFAPVEMSSAMGGEMPVDGMTDPFANLALWADRAELAGREEVAGVNTFVIRITDFSGMPMSEVDGFEASEARMFIDGKDYLIRRFTMLGKMDRAGQTRDVTIQAEFSDYRTVQGVTHPFRVDLSTEGMLDSGEQQQMRDQLEELEEQLANMPAAQRSMVEGMMKGQLDQMRGMLDEGGLSTSVIVSELRVNTPAG